jgi:hypothetical protein
MKTRIVGAMALAVLVVAGAVADEALKSGPQKGSSKIFPFNPLHCSGPGEGGKACLV